MFNGFGKYWPEVNHAARELRFQVLPPLLLYRFFVRYYIEQRYRYDKSVYRKVLAYNEEVCGMGFVCESFGRHLTGILDRN